MKKIALYARVSTLLLQDYERQLFLLKKEIEKHNHHTPDFNFENDVEIFAEKISGFKKNNDRPELKKLIDKVEEEPEYFSSVYITEISRLGRDPNETRKTIDRLTELGIALFVQSINQFTLDENGKRNSIMNIIIQVLMEFAAEEAETIKSRMRSGKLEKVSTGRTAGNNQAFGYIANEEKMLVIDESEAEVVRQIFLLYKDGKGTQSIADTLNQLNIPTRLAKTHKDKMITFSKTNTEKSGSDIRWDGNTILQMLKNTSYKGERKFKGHIFNNIPPIVSAELFDECNDLIKSKSHRNYLTSYEYLLRDLMRCGCCGRKYIGKYSPKKSGDKVYKCTSYLPSQKAPCGQLSINISQVESIIYDQLLKSDSILKYLDNPKDVKKVVEKELKALEQEKRIKQSELDTANLQLEKVLDLFTSGSSMTKEIYQKKEKEVLKVINSASENLEKINTNIKLHNLTLAGYDENKATTEMLLNAKHNRLELSGIFRQFIDKIVIYNFNKNYSILNIYIKLNGIVLLTPLKLLIDLRGVKLAGRNKGKYYKYISIHRMENEPVLNEKNILINDLNDMYSELENTIYWANKDDANGILPMPRFTKVPIENYLYINPEDI